MRRYDPIRTAALREALERYDPHGWGTMTHRVIVTTTVRRDTGRVVMCVDEIEGVDYSPSTAPLERFLRYATSDVRNGIGTALDEATML